MSRIEYRAVLVWVSVVLLVIPSESSCQGQGWPVIAAAGVAQTTDAEGSVVLSGHTGAVISVAVHPEGQHLLSASDDGTVRGWETSTGAEMLKVLTSKGGGYFCVTFNSDGTQFAAGSAAGEINVYEFPSGKSVSQFDGNGKQIQGITFSRHGAQLMTGGLDKAVTWWDLKTGKVSSEFRASRSAITSVIVTPNGKELLSAGGDGVLRVFNQETGKVRVDWSAVKGPIYGLAISPDGKFVASACDDKTVRVRRLAGKKTDKDTHVLQGHTDRVMGVAFLGDGQYLVSGGFDKKLILWDLKAKRPVKEWPAHQNSQYGVRGIAVDPKGKFIATGGYDAQVRLWKPDLPLPSTTAGQETAATVTADRMTIERFDVKDAPDFLSRAVRLVPDDKEIQKAKSDDYDIVFEKPGALFLRVRPLTPPQNPDWYDATRQKRLKRMGWLSIGKCPWDETSSLWMIPMVDATSVQIKLPPGMRWISLTGENLEDLELLAVDHESYADSKHRATFGTAFEAMFARVRALTYFRAKRWTDLERLLSDARKSKRRYPDGRSELEQLYLGIMAPSGNSSKEYLELLADYRRKVPNSAAVKLAEVDLLVNQAWQLRGGGTADTVTPEGAKAMRDMAAKAPLLLKKASNAAQDDPHIDKYLLRSAIGGSPRIADLQKIARANLKKDSWDWEQVVTVTYYLLPRWFGDAKSASTFASQLQQEFADSSGPALYCAAALGIFRMEPDEWETERGFDYQRMLTGLETFQQRFPENTLIPIQACQAAAHRGDLQTARKVYESLEGRMNLSDWGSDALAVEWYEYFNPPAKTQILWQTTALTSGISRLRYDLTGDKLHVATPMGSVRTFDAKTGKVLAAMPLGFQVPLSVAGRDNGEVLVGTAKFVESFKSDNQMKPVRLSTQQPLLAASLSVDGTLYGTISETNEGGLFSTETGKPLHVFPNVVEPNSTRPDSVKFSPDASRVVFFGLGSKISVYDSRTGMLLRTLSNGETLIEALAFHSAGRKLLATGMGKQFQWFIWEWDVDTGEIVWQIPSPRSQLRRLAVTADGSRIAVALDYTYEFLYGTKLWIISKDQPFEKENFVLEQRQAINDLSWSPDGQHLAVIEESGFVRVFDFQIKTP